MDSSKLMKKIWNKMCDRIVVILTILSICSFLSGCNSSSEPKVREPIGYAVVNGERYDITFYATNYGHPYIKTVDGMEICGGGITVFIPND